MRFDLDRDLNRFNVSIERSSLLKEFQIKIQLTSGLHLHMFRLELGTTKLKLDARVPCAKLGR